MLGGRMAGRSVSPHTPPVFFFDSEMTKSSSAGFLLPAFSITIFGMVLS